MTHETKDIVDHAMAILELQEKITPSRVSGEIDSFCAERDVLEHLKGMVAEGNDLYEMVDACLKFVFETIDNINDEVVTDSQTEALLRRERLL